MCRAILALLSQAEPDSPLNCDAGLRPPPKSPYCPVAKPAPDAEHFLPPLDAHRRVAH